MEKNFGAGKMDGVCMEGFTILILLPWDSGKWFFDSGITDLDIYDYPCCKLLEKKHV